MRAALRLGIPSILSLVLALPAPAAPPAAVSPLGAVGERCPTFSWAAVPGAPGYELVVYEVAAEVGEEPRLSDRLSVRLPAGATVWTPAMDDCLAAGGEYAWVLRVLGRDGEEGWSEPALFEVAPAPTLDEVQTAIAALRRQLAAKGGEGAEPSTPSAAASSAPRVEALAREWRERRRLFPPPAAGQGELAIPAAAPSLGAPSLTLDGNVALGAASNVFKDGAVFLWDDTTGNTALGREALASASGNARYNTAVGWEALELTVPGPALADGSFNVAVGFRVLKNNTLGHGNTAVGAGTAYLNEEGDLNTALGSRALFSNTTGSSNTTVGAYNLYLSTTGVRNTTTGDMTLADNLDGSENTGAGSFALFRNSSGSSNAALGLGTLQNNTTGSRNLGLGYFAGLHPTGGNDNVFIASYGTTSDSETIRIGIEGVQDGTFVAGIRGTTTGVADAVPVMIDSAGQLGTVSSSRAVKQEIRDVGEVSRALFGLSPVAFRYRDQAARDPDAPLQFGLIAEEVAEVFPELAVRGADGQAQTVKYHLLPPLLLNELQRLHRRLADRRLELHALRERLSALERGPPS